MISESWLCFSGSTSSCSVSAGKLTTKYCGAYLGLLGQSGAIAGTIGLVCGSLQIFICKILCQFDESFFLDCTAPFRVGFRTDAISQGTTLPSRGDFNLGLKKFV